MSDNYTKLENEYILQDVSCNSNFESTKHQTIQDWFPDFLPIPESTSSLDALPPFDPGLISFSPLPTDKHNDALIHFSGSTAAAAAADACPVLNDTYNLAELKSLEWGNPILDSSFCRTSIVDSVSISSANNSESKFVTEYTHGGDSNIPQNINRLQDVHRSGTNRIPPNEMSCRQTVILPPYTYPNPVVPAFIPNQLPTDDCSMRDSRPVTALIKHASDEPFWENSEVVAKENAFNIKPYNHYIPNSCVDETTHIVQLCQTLKDEHRSLPDTSGDNRNIFNLESYNASTSSNRSYFWQYNSQCKGPKSIRMLQLNHSAHRIQPHPDEPDSTVSMSSFDLDPLDQIGLLEDTSLETSSYVIPRQHTHSASSLPDYPLVVFEDPVQRRYDLVHCSKLRRGDGNDVTPNLARLHTMGEELDSLSQRLMEHGEIILNGIATSGEITSSQDHLCPVGTYTDSKAIDQAKREKNKLASKICRLKKKAFHEANKIKYTALGMEYHELAVIIVQLRNMIQSRLRPIESKRGYFANGPLNIPSEDYSKCQQPRFNPDANYGNTSNCTTTICADYPSLLKDGLCILEQFNVTHAAGRTDAMVDDVLKLFRAGHLNNPLVKGLTSENPNQVEFIKGGKLLSWPQYQPNIPYTNCYYQQPDLSNQNSTNSYSSVTSVCDTELQQPCVFQPPQKYQISYYSEPHDYRSECTF